MSESQRDLYTEEQLAEPCSVCGRTRSACIDEFEGRE